MSNDGRVEDLERGKQRIAAIVAGTSRDGVEVILRQGGRVRVVKGALSAKLTWAETPSDDAPKDREGLLRRSRLTINGLVPGRRSVKLVGVGLPPDLQPRTIEVAPGKTERVDFGR